MTALRHRNYLLLRTTLFDVIQTLRQDGLILIREIQPSRKISALALKTNDSATAARCLRHFRCYTSFPRAFNHYVKELFIKILLLTKSQFKASIRAIWLHISGASFSGTLRP